jgi:hypothetical protein
LMSSLINLFGFLAVVCRGLTLALSAVLAGSITFSLICLRSSNSVCDGSFADVLVRVRRFVLVCAEALFCVEGFWLTANSALLADTLGVGFQ